MSYDDLWDDHYDNIYGKVRETNIFSEEEQKEIEDDIDFWRKYHSDRD